MSNTPLVALAPLAVLLCVTACGDDSVGPRDAEPDAAVDGAPDGLPDGVPDADLDTTEAGDDPTPDLPQPDAPLPDVVGDVPLDLPDTPPETNLESGPPASTWEAHAVFSFSTPSGNRFECRLGTEPFAPCTSPHVVYGLALGPHTFAVRALDALDRRDLTPASASWTVTSVYDAGLPGLESGRPEPGPDPDGGSFRIKCEVSHFSYDDPIVFPGEAGAAHLHMFFGNTLTDADSTVESLISTGTSTCNGSPLNRSSYWVPALLAPVVDEGGEVVVRPDGRPDYEVVLPAEGPFSTDIYYKASTEDLEAIQPMPAGLRMIAGVATSTSNQGAEVVRWSCASWPITSADDFVGYIPACDVGDEVRLTLLFPPCWNGVDLDSPNHRSHMGYVTYTEGRGLHCPDSHPVPLTQVSYNLAFPVTEANAGAYGDSRDWRLASDQYAEWEGLPGGFSAHGDWFFAWHPEVMDTWIEECIRTGSHCAGGDLGNGFALVGLPTGDTEAPEVVNRGLGVRGDALRGNGDSFDNAGTLGRWRLRYQAEGDVPRHDTLAIDGVLDSSLVIDPNDYDDPALTDDGVGGWFQDRKGPFVYQLVTGNFAARAALQVGTVADLEAAPNGDFNAGGWLVRDPSSFDPEAPDALGEERWVMYNIGNQAGSWASEAKTTVPDGADGDSESDSTLFLTPIGTLAGELIICRVGDTLRFFRRLAGATEWTQEAQTDGNLHHNGAALTGPDYSAYFTREDFSTTVQLGLIANRYGLGTGSPVRVAVDEVELRTPASLAECTSLFE